MAKESVTLQAALDEERAARKVERNGLQRRILELEGKGQKGSAKPTSVEPGVSKAQLAGLEERLEELTRELKAATKENEALAKANEGLTKKLEKASKKK